MNFIKTLLLKTGGGLLALAVSTASSAVTLDTLYSFGHNTNNYGSYPMGLIQGADGNLYGTTSAGGPKGYGTVFRLGTNGGLTILAAFDGTNGNGVIGQLVQDTNGTFYGATTYGGSGYGAVFQVTTNGELTLMASAFTNDGLHGYYPSAGLVQGTDGLFYGPTYYGSTNSYNYGTIFSMTTGGVMNTLANFAGTNGTYPVAALVQGSDGNFYGTTIGGGTNYNGTIFKITANGVLTCLHSFIYSEGASPNSLMQGLDGSLYGTTSSGGTNGYGTIFKITTNGVLTCLHSFIYTEGYGPNNLVRGTDDILYGTTISGGPNGNGTIFKVTTNGEFTTLHSFDYLEGNQPASLVLASDGNLYGARNNGGTNGCGTLFKTTTNGEVTTLWSFDNSSSTDGSTPDKPVQGVGGVFYGITESGGTCGYGTFYKMSTNGQRTGLYSFTGLADGSCPNSLVLGRDGFYYGTTANGGTNDYGTVFKATTNGTLIALHRFNGDDGHQPVSLIVGLDGNLYGTTEYGGMDDCGTVFKITTNGMLTTLHSFNYADGSYPNGLVQRNDGNFYGTTINGGTNGNGTIFILTPSGALTTLYNFNGNDGSAPNCLMQGPDGNLYGTTEYGSMIGDGIVFKLQTNGSLTTLHTFTGDEGYQPMSLAPGGDGNLYGAAFYGGTNGTGVLFKLKTNGTYTTLYHFNYNDGGGPNSLVQGKDYNFYGTTWYGGLNGQGTFFRLNVLPAPSIVTQPASVISLNGATATFSVDADGILPLRYQWRKDSANLINGGNVSGATSPTLTLSHVSQADAGAYSVVITNNFGSAASSNATLTVLLTLVEALDATNLVWTTGGDADWFGQIWTTLDGVDAAQSGVIVDWQMSWMETAVTGPGTLTFWWKVSCEADYDALYFLVNDAPAAVISGEVDWQQKTIGLGAGSQTLSWVYNKDFSTTLGDDRGWVDQVSFAPAAAAPVLQCGLGTNHTFSLSWNALPGRMYQMQYSTNLLQTNWTDWGAPGTNGFLSVPIGPDRQRFYRVYLVP
jgi:uncharacterized repeat protein (TIGR03803 family)